jgi:pimeloyl-ACP methyl ester carboxylesterase
VGKTTFASVSNSLFICNKDANWHCFRYGSGSKVLLAFHGFSQDHHFFASLEAELGEEYTIWAVDMPGHGKTEWESRKICRPEIIAALASEIMEQTALSKVDVIGFSMGGRYAWVLAQEYPQMINRLYLASTEGLTTNFGVSVFASNPVGRFLLHKLITMPWMVMAPAYLIRKLKLISEKLYQFILLNTNSKKIRGQLETAWIAMSGLKPSQTKLAAVMNSQQTPVFTIIGSKDPLIKVADAKSLADKMHYGQLVVIPKGHFVVDHNLGRRMREFQ